MRIMIIGAYGMIGSAIANRLSGAGHEIVGVGRSIVSARRKMPYIEWIEGDLAIDQSPHLWQQRLIGIDVVIHAAGLLQDGINDDVRAVQVSGTNALYEACEYLQIRRVIHISAIGASPQAETMFMTSKAEADDALQKRDLDWVILRPGLVLSRQAYGGTALLRCLAAFPLFIPMVSGSGLVQSIAVEDITATIEALLLPDAPRTGIWELAHSEKLHLEDIVAGLRGWLGLAPAPMIHVPNPFLRIFTLLGDAIAWLGWRNPLRSTSLKQIEEGVVGNTESWIQEFSIKPLSFQATLAATPANIQDLWHARLFFLKPLVFVTLVLFWLITGLITLGPAYAEGVARFASIGLGSLGPALTIGGGILDIMLAALLAWRRTAPIALTLMALVSVGYLVTASLLMPELWLDPLGPLLKIFPVLMLTGIAAALLPSR